MHTLARNQTERNLAEIRCPIWPSSGTGRPAPHPTFMGVFAQTVIILTAETQAVQRQDFKSKASELKEFCLWLILVR
jgi:hypothetical protein